jgi:hypothetical protein
MPRGKVQGAIHARSTQSTAPRAHLADALFAFPTVAWAGRTSDRPRGGSRCAEAAQPAARPRRDWGSRRRRTGGRSRRRPAVRRADHGRQHAAHERAAGDRRGEEVRARPRLAAGHLSPQISPAAGRLVASGGRMDGNPGQALVLLGWWALTTIVASITRGSLRRGARARPLAAALPAPVLTGPSAGATTAAHRANSAEHLDHLLLTISHEPRAPREADCAAGVDRRGRARGAGGT